MAKENYSRISRIAMAGLVAGATLLNSGCASADPDSSRYFNFKTQETSLEEVIEAAKTGEFDIYTDGGSIDNAREVLLDRKGGYGYLDNSTSFKKVEIANPQDLGKLLRTVDGGAWNSGAGTGINPDSGKAEVYALPKATLYRFEADKDGKTFKYVVEGGDSSGGGAGGGAGGGGGGGAGGGGGGGAGGQ